MILQNQKSNDLDTRADAHSLKTSVHLMSGEIDHTPHFPQVAITTWNPSHVQVPTQ